MSVIWGLLLLSLLALFCEGYNITLPSSSISVGEVNAFPWFWNATDFKLSSSGVFVVVLVNSAKEFDCPLQPSNVGLGFDTIPKIMEGSLVAKNPLNGTDSSGKFLLIPSHPGDHMICTYGNLPTDALNPDSFKFNPNEFAKILNSLQFIDQSEKFNVMQATQPTSTTMAPSENSTNTGDDDDNNRDDHRSDDHHNGHANDNNVPVGAIIGAVIGGVVLIILLLLVFFYRKRFTHQRKVNQFHRERMLFHQQPPPSFISSTGASTVLPHVTSPQATLTARPLSPKRPSHIPGEFEGTARKNYPYPVHSDDHSDSLYSPSSYSFALPNVESTPVFRAQHAPAMGTQQV